MPVRFIGSLATLDGLDVHLATDNMAAIRSRILWSAVAWYRFLFFSFLLTLSIGSMERMENQQKEIQSDARPSHSKVGREPYAPLSLDICLTNSACSGLDNPRCKAA